jgi:putative sterol carrier protein
VQLRFPDEPDIVVTTDTLVWKENLPGHRNATVAFAGGAVEVEGSTIELVKFPLLFRP